LLIGERAVPLRFMEKVIRAGGDNGQRSCEVMNEEIE